MRSGAIIPCLAYAVIATAGTVGGTAQTGASFQDTTGYLDFPTQANENGDFERGTSEHAEQWEVTGEAPLMWRRTGSGARSGAHAMALAPRGANPQHVSRLQSEPIPVEPGDVVKFNAWLYADGPDAQHLPHIHAEGLTGSTWSALDPSPYVVQPPVKQWFPVGNSVIVPEGVSQVRLIAAADGRAVANGTIWRLDEFYSDVTSLRAYVEARRNAPRLPDILLLGADTLRQSPLGCYGSDVHTPNIDMIANEGALFRHVMTCSSWTRPSFASIFSSLYPSQHTAEMHNSVLPSSVTTLAELLRDKGYFTIGFAMTTFDGFVGPGAGFAQGFDAFFHFPDEVTVHEQFMRFLSGNASALKQLQGGLFIFRHFYEPHAPYENRWPEIIKNEGLMGTHDFTSHMLYESLYRQLPGVANEKDIEYAVRIYESEAYKVDTLIGEVLAPLRYYGLYDAMNIVLCSDHGEAFNEKPGSWNHMGPYNPCTEVPLIMRLPALLPSGTRVDEPVISNVDIMPTLLEVAGIDVPDFLEGHSLLAHQDIPENRLVVSEDKKNGSMSIRSRRYKLVAIPAALPRVSGQDPYELWKSMQAGVIDKPFSDALHLIDGPRDWVLLGKLSPTRFELYDLEEDPFENRDIADENLAEFRHLLIELLAHCARSRIYSMADIQTAQQFDLTEEELAAIEASAARGHGAIEHDASDIELTPETLESLRNQGYF